MSDILQIVYYLSIIMIVFPIGFSIILLAKTQQENWIPKSFLYGTAVLLICAYWISYFYKGGLRIPSKFLVALVIAGAIIIGVIRKEKVFEYIHRITKRDITNIILSIFLGTLPLLIVLKFGAQYPYCDGYTYVCNADFLMDYGYNVEINSNDMILHPWLSQTALYQEHHLRIGSQMFLALFAGLFNVQFSLELFLPVISFGVFLCGMASWSFASKRYTESPYFKTLAIIMVMANVPIVLGNAVYGFLPQTFGSAFFLAAVAAISCLEEWKTSSIWSIGSTALLFSCCALSYNEMLPFLVLVTAVLAIRYFVMIKNERKLLVFYLGGCALVAIMLIVTFVPGMIQSTLMQLGSVVGWHQDKDINTYLAYFLSTVPAEYSFLTVPYSMELFCYEMLTILGAGVVIIGFCKISTRVRKEYLYVSLPYGLMLIYFMLFVENPWLGGRGNSWNIYKLMQYYFVVAIPYIIICVSEMLGKVKKTIAWFGIAGYVALNIVNIVSYMESLSFVMENYVGAQERSIEEYYDLYEEFGQDGQRIILYNVPDKHRQMITYFLKDVELVSDWNEDVYYTNIPEVPEELFETGISMTYNLAEPGHFAGLVECETGIILGEGFYGKENLDGDYWNWSKKESQISLIECATESNLSLSFEVHGLVQEKKEKLYMYSEANQLLEVIEIEPNEIASVMVNIPAETNTLYFEYSGAEMVAENDSRELAFAIRNYRIFVGD